ncbi:phosphorelay protein LuxU [Vibrio zhanjiangensis]|uniref:Phosphorelay protein LuxU n=1 Tax=Vibrio zhanjiangensis TaxID=1046128 RepID=A0ABQ6EXL5_9VIBR|nr:quorum-sensing phosphorelay protein LuxU [Vibrio zhanjiangensis]GLT17569.1 phosphorelay protein LuxU [Vibrio zhanjiangensis]
MELLNRHKLDQLSSEIGASNVPILLDIFLNEMTQYIEALNDDTRDHEAYLKEICHALKSSAASFGAESLCAFAIEIDAKAKLDEMLDVVDTRETMLKLLTDTQQRYKALLSK